MKYLINLILLTFTLIFTSCYSQAIEGQNRKLENQTIDKLSNDKTAYQQFIILSKAICYDKFSENSLFFEENYIEMFNHCTEFSNENFPENSKYVKCFAFPRLLNNNGEELKQYIYKYINNNKYSINSTEVVCNNLFLNNPSTEKVYKKFIYNKKNYVNGLNYKNMSNEIEDYLKYGYILIMVE